jgi:hypothetical protein
VAHEQLARAAVPRLIDLDGCSICNNGPGDRDNFEHHLVKSATDNDNYPHDKYPQNQPV